MLAKRGEGGRQGERKCEKLVCIAHKSQRCLNPFLHRSLPIITHIKFNCELGVLFKMRAMLFCRYPVKGVELERECIE